MLSKKKILIYAPQKTLPKTNAVASHAKVLLWSVWPALDVLRTKTISYKDNFEQG